ncbi:glutamate 5-kinase [Blyttiomyces helicus]|uniref:Glutamate 5-kinase n=1 Tax=Blyttiomyces helicus TaxID=388810 RepID=A0A4P9WNA8_9FUNG|nr:glutamate 5-kinase [Blyttiomyces helicus]|eukprot:RKO93553.1 glutamate 5-kinase [Blyttiomyces helicus]
MSAVPPDIPKNVRSAYRRTNPLGGLTIVIKLGTSSICDEKTFMPKLSNLSLLVETVVALRADGHKIVLVSSGAVGVGLRRLQLGAKPKHLPKKQQAVAAVGQGRLMALYDSLFSQFDVPIAQVLLTRDSLAERTQYLNACNTFKELLLMDVVPIVNENDAVSHAELRFGDNDTLSAIAAGMVNGDYLFLLTDVDCLYTDNPRTNPDAKAVRVVEDVGKLKEKVTVTSPGSSLGTGGMVTKLIAADLATAAGCSTIVSLGSAPQKILSILNEVAAHRSRPAGTPFTPTIGTHFLAKRAPMMDRKWWILHGLSAAGAVYLDAGAVQAVVRPHRSSLFAAGIVRVEGTFGAQQAVRILTVVAVRDAEDRVVELGKGIVNYSSTEIARIRGHRSAEIEALLGYVDSGWVVHRDNLVITNRAVDPAAVVFKTHGSPTGVHPDSDAH